MYSLANGWAYILRGLKPGIFKPWDFMVYDKKIYISILKAQFVKKSAHYKRVNTVQ